MIDERYEDCDRCEERFVGEEAIFSYLHVIEVGDEIETRCVSCLAEAGGGPPDRQRPHDERYALAREARGAS